MQADRLLHASCLTRWEQAERQKSSTVLLAFVSRKWFLGVWEELRGRTGLADRNGISWRSQVEFGVSLPSWEKMAPSSLGGEERGLCVQAWQRPGGGEYWGAAGPQRSGAWCIQAEGPGSLVKEFCASSVGHKQQRPTRPRPHVDLDSRCLSGHLDIPI